MHMSRTVFLVVNVLTWFIQRSHCETGFCGTRKPVVRVCTGHELSKKRSVNIDTLSVPRYQTNVCKCAISSRSDAEFIFTYKDIDNTDVKHMWFEISDQKINASSRDGTRIGLVDQAELLFFLTSNSTEARACLIVTTEDEVEFNITCRTNSTHDETSTLRHSTADSTERTASVREQQVERENKGKSNINNLIPVVAAAAAGVVCVSVVVVVIVICRRKSLSDKQGSDTSTAVVDKENEDGYYMTDNPMYNVDDSQPNIQSSEREYHYIEPDNKGDRMSSSQYESMQDLPVKNQSPNKQVNPDLHYDYSTCSSAGQKYEPGSRNRIDKGKAESKGECRALPNNKQIVGKTMYDRTDTAVETFQSDNEYHHINPAASRNRGFMDTYNTIGNVNNKQKGNTEDEENSDYHVPNLP